MTNENSQTLQFTVKEAVWFEKGKEIEDILSMSLEPEITIQEHDNYISIRGALQLEGEYSPKTTDLDQLFEDSLQEISMKRTIDKVVEIDENVYKMQHQFPIDITIPMNRISSIDDVYVMVESFDYELPSGSNSLQLVAEIAISGVSGERKKQQEAISKEQQENTSFASFSIEARKELVERNEENAEAINEEQPVQEESSDTSLKSGEIVRLEAPEAIERKEPEANIFQEAKEDTEERLEKDEAEETENTTQRSELEDSQELDQDDTNKLHVEVNSRQESKQEEEEGETATVSEKKSMRDENALYLTKILANESGQENVATIRMRIVQAGETLGDLANYYDVPVSKLMQMNKLEDEYLQEGAIIYVPAIIE